MEKQTLELLYKKLSVWKGFLNYLPKEPGSDLIMVFLHMLLCCMLSAGVLQVNTRNIKLMMHRIIWRKMP